MWATGQGTPSKQLKIKTHIRYIYNIGLYGTLFKSTTTTIITRIYDKKLCKSSQVFLGGWTRLRILPLPVPPRTSWIETAFNNRYKFTAIKHLVEKKKYFFLSFCCLRKLKRKGGGKKPAFDWFFSSHKNSFLFDFFWFFCFFKWNTSRRNFSLLFPNSELI